MSDEQQSEPQPPMAIPVDEPEEPSRMARLRAAWDPVWAQTRQNLRVWIPWLATRRDQSCRVRVPSRDHRTGLTWEVTLPEQCWFCATRERLEPRTFEGDVRCFEHPLQIVGVAAAAGAFLLLLTCLWRGMAVASLLALLGGVAVLFLKSWHEQVRLVVWSCADHQSQLRRPEMVVYEEDLTLVLGSESLAAAMRAQLKALRKVKPHGARDAKAADSAESPASHPGYTPTAPRPKPAADLPKIKLAGDEEE